MKEIKEPILILLVLFILFGFAYGPLKKANLNRSDNIKNAPASETANVNSDYLSNEEIAQKIKYIKTELDKISQNINKK